MTTYNGIMHIRGAKGKVLCKNRKAVMACGIDQLTLGYAERVCAVCLPNVSKEGRAKISALKCEPA